VAVDRDTIGVVRNAKQQAKEIREYLKKSHYKMGALD